MQNISHRLKSLRSQLRVTQEELAERIGFARNYISMIERGDKKPGPRFLKQLELIEKAPLTSEHKEEKYTEAPPRDTVIHERERPRERESLAERIRNSADAVRERILELMQLAPIISWARGGEESSFYEDQGHDVPRIAVPCKDPNCYVLELEGNSMEPTYVEGDLLVVAPNLEARSNDLVVVRTVDGKVFFKKMRQPPRGEYIQFISYNTNQEPIFLLPQEIHKISVVHSVIRPLRERVRAMAITDF